MAKTLVFHNSSINNHGAAFPKPSFPQWFRCGRVRKLIRYKTSILAYWQGTAGAWRMGPVY
jgi:hypothetical protein